MSDCIGKLEELTERLLAKELLVASENGGHYVDYVQDCTIPMWMKTKSSKVLFVNQAFTKLFNQTVEDYQSSEDEPHYIYDYKRNDRQVFSSGVAKFFVESSPQGDVLVYKWPFFNEQGDLLGLGALAIPNFG